MTWKNKSTRKLKRKNILQQISFLTSVLDLNFSFKSDPRKCCLFEYGFTLSESLLMSNDMDDSAETTIGGFSLERNERYFAQLTIIYQLK